MLAPTCLKTVQFPRWRSAVIDCSFQIYFITPLSKLHSCSEISFMYYLLCVNLWSVMLRFCCSFSVGFKWDKCYERYWKGSISSKYSILKYCWWVVFCFFSFIRLRPRQYTGQQSLIHSVKPKMLRLMTLRCLKFSPGHILLERHLIYWWIKLIFPRKQVSDSLWKYEDRLIILECSHSWKDQ